MPAAMHMAGHQTQWNRMMSLPIRWCTCGHHGSKRSGSCRSRWPYVVDQRVVPDVEDVGRVPGTLTPQSMDVRVMEMSSRPPLMKLSASLRFDSGSTTSGWAEYQSSSRLREGVSRKK